MSCTDARIVRLRHGAIGALTMAEHGMFQKRFHAGKRVLPVLYPARRT